MLNFDRSTVRHGTQNIQNDCHQWISDSFRVHQFHFWPGLHPTGEAYNAPLDPLAGLRGPTSNGEGREGRGERERKGGDKKNRSDRPRPFCKFLDPPLVSIAKNSE